MNRIIVTTLQLDARCVFHKLSFLLELYEYCWLNTILLLSRRVLNAILLLSGRVLNAILLLSRRVLNAILLLSRRVLNAVLLLSRRVLNSKFGDAYREFAAEDPSIRYICLLNQCDLDMFVLVILGSDGTVQVLRHIFLVLKPRRLMCSNFEKFTALLEYLLFTCSFCT